MTALPKAARFWMVCRKPTGNSLFAGTSAGRALLATPGLFSFRGRCGGALNGARAASATHANKQRAPKAGSVLHCPLWPDCGCPGGTMRPECPGLKSRIDSGRET